MNAPRERLRIGENRENYRSDIDAQPEVRGGLVPALREKRRGRASEGHNDRQAKASCEVQGKTRWLIDLQSHCETHAATPTLGIGKSRENMRPTTPLG